MPPKKLRVVPKFPAAPQESDASSDEEPWEDDERDEDELYRDLFDASGDETDTTVASRTTTVVDDEEEPVFEDIMTFGNIQACLQIEEISD